MIQEKETARIQFAFSTLQFIGGIIVFLLSVGAALASVNAQLNANRDVMQEIRKDLSAYREQIQFIRQQQIRNEGLIDQLRRDMDRIDPPARNK